ncbi:MAG: hypothetical protein RLZZ338_4215 [Cyanobacteriota bacterium]|jgi:hypothetical protein
MIEPRDEYDNPWKEAISIYFQPFIELLFPDVNAIVDWKRDYEFLDTVLQQVTRDDEIGERTADKLVKVWLKDGTETWILIHVEVQSQYQANFAERMYVYNSRIFGVYRQKVLSLAVLADDSPTWYPTQFEYNIGGCQVLLKFVVTKLLDYQQQWNALEQSLNPFSAIIMAHLKTQGTRQKPEDRLQWKLRIIKGLYQQGNSREDIRELFRLIDWLMALPQPLDNSFQTEIKRFEEEKIMPYVTSIERLGIQTGRLTSCRQYIIDILEIRFEVVPMPLRETINKLEDINQLENLHKQAVTIASLADFQQLINS